jgi:hypothetical protein
VGRLPLVEMIIVGAKILIRAVLGRHVRQLQLRRLGAILGKGVCVGMMEPS